MSRTSSRRHIDRFTRFFLSPERFFLSVKTKSPVPLCLRESDFRVRSYIYFIIHIYICVRVSNTVSLNPSMMMMMMMMMTTTSVLGSFFLLYRWNNRMEMNEKLDFEENRASLECYCTYTHNVRETIVTFSLIKNDWTRRFTLLENRVGKLRTPNNGHSPYATWIVRPGYRWNVRELRLRISCRSCSAIQFKDKQWSTFSVHRLILPRDSRQCAFDRSSCAAYNFCRVQSKRTLRT